MAPAPLAPCRRSRTARCGARSGKEFPKPLPIVLSEARSPLRNVAAENQQSGGESLAAPRAAAPPDGTPFSVTVIAACPKTNCALPTRKRKAHLHCANPDELRPMARWRKIRDSRAGFLDAGLTGVTVLKGHSSNLFSELDWKVLRGLFKINSLSLSRN
jgi:hypothetical protein